MSNKYFIEKIEKIEDLLFGFAMKLTKNRENAKDLMQETLRRAYENRVRYRIGTHFKSWLTTIMYNTFVNDYRKRKTRNKVEQPVEDIVFLEDRKTTEGRGDRNILRKELNDILQEIDGKYSKPFLMFFKGYHYDEISDQMDLPIGTVKSRIFYARKKLKEIIKSYYGAENLLRA